MTKQVDEIENIDKYRDNVTTEVNKELKKEGFSETKQETDINLKEEQNKEMEAKVIYIEKTEEKAIKIDIQVKKQAEIEIEEIFEDKIMKDYEMNKKKLLDKKGMKNTFKHIEMAMEVEEESVENATKDTAGHKTKEAIIAVDKAKVEGKDELKNPTKSVDKVKEQEEIKSGEILKQSEEKRNNNFVEDLKNNVLKEADNISKEENITNQDNQIKKTDKSKEKVNVELNKETTREALRETSQDSNIYNKEQDTYIFNEADVFGSGIGTKSMKQTKEKNKNVVNISEEEPLKKVAKNENKKIYKEAINTEDQAEVEINVKGKEIIHNQDVVEMDIKSQKNQEKYTTDVLKTFYTKTENEQIVETNQIDKSNNIDKDKARFNIEVKKESTKEAYQENKEDANINVIEEQDKNTLLEADVLSMEKINGKTIEVDMQVKKQAKIKNVEIIEDKVMEDCEKNLKEAIDQKSLEVSKENFKHIEKAMETENESDENANKGAAEPKNVKPITTVDKAKLEGKVEGMLEKTIKPQDEVEGQVQMECKETQEQLKEKHKHNFLENPKNNEFKTALKRTNEEKTLTNQENNIKITDKSRTKVHVKVSDKEYDINKEEKHDTYILNKGDVLAAKQLDKLAEKEYQINTKEEIENMATEHSKLSKKKTLNEKSFEQTKNNREKIEKVENESVEYTTNKANKRDNKADVKIKVENENIIKTQDKVEEDINSTNVHKKIEKTYGPKTNALDESHTKTENEKMTKHVDEIINIVKDKETFTIEVNKELTKEVSRETKEEANINAKEVKNTLMEAEIVDIEKIKGKAIEIHMQVEKQAQIKIEGIIEDKVMKDCENNYKSIELSKQKFKHIENVMQVKEELVKNVNKGTSTHKNKEAITTVNVPNFEVKSELENAVRPLDEVEEHAKIDSKETLKQSKEEHKPNLLILNKAEVLTTAKIDSCSYKHDKKEYEIKMKDKIEKIIEDCEMSSIKALNTKSMEQTKDEHINIERVFEEEPVEKAIINKYKQKTKEATKTENSAEVELQVKGAKVLNTQDEVEVNISSKKAEEKYKNNLIDDCESKALHTKIENKKMTKEIQKPNNTSQATKTFNIKVNQEPTKEAYQETNEGANKNVKDVQYNNIMIEAEVIPTDEIKKKAKDKDNQVLKQAKIKSEEIYENIDMEDCERNPKTTLHKNTKEAALKEDIKNRDKRGEKNKTDKHPATKGLKIKAEQKDDQKLKIKLDQESNIKLKQTDDVIPKSPDTTDIKITNNKPIKETVSIQEVGFDEVEFEKDSQHKDIPEKLSNTNVQENEKPFFSRIKTDNLVSSGGSMALQVEIKGNADIFWFKDSAKLPKASLKHRTFEEGGVHTLLISNVTKYDTGKYTCRASNLYGRTETSSYVQIVYPSSIRDGKPAMFISRPDNQMTVSTGQDIVVSFRLAGDPKPLMVWMKGLRDISNGYRSYKETYDDYFRLTLKRATEEDQGTYCILARNRFGTDRAFFTVRLRNRAGLETPISRQTAEGILTKIPSYQERHYLTDVPGPIQGVPVLTDTGRNWVSLSWNKPDHRGAAPVIAYKVDAWLRGGEGARWTELGISPINSFDAFNLKPEGQYQFRITPRNRYGWGDSVQSAPLKIGTTVVLPEFIKLLPEQLKVLLGSDVTLKCEVRSESSLNLKWFWDGSEIVPKNQDRYQIDFDNNVASLFITGIKENDTGRVMCEAINKAGRISTSAWIITVSNPKIMAAVQDLELREIGTLKPKKLAPQFTMRLQDRRVQVSYSIRLACQVVGCPEPTVVWFKGKEIIKQNAIFNFRSEEHLQILEINNASFEDSSEYCILAENIHGSVSCTCNLIVDKGLKAYIPPQFCSNLQASINIQEGQELRISGKLEAYPAVRVLWFKDGVRLRSSRKSIFTLSHDGTIELVISFSTNRDAGVYTCVATNEVGRVESSSCSVNILKSLLAAKSNLVANTSARFENILYSKEPKFVKKPLQTEAFEGDSVIISCEVIGDPKPEVVWFRDFLKSQYYRDAPHFHCVDNGPEYRLEISQLKLDFTGTYTVCAQNCYGDTKATISLQIKVKDGNSNLDVKKQVTKKSIQSIPEIIQQLTNVRCCDGDSATLKCSFLGAPYFDVRWEKDGKLVHLGENFFADFDGESYRLSINPVYSEDEGEYTCVAYNYLGQSFTSACLLVDSLEEKYNLVKVKQIQAVNLSAVTTISSTKILRNVYPRFRPNAASTRGTSLSRRRATAPKFYTIPHNRIAEEGETVRFQCAVSGYPDPSIKWDKDQTSLTSSSKITISESYDLKFLEIRDVSFRDSGLYRVVLENYVGRVEATARLDVIAHQGASLTRLRARSRSPKLSATYTRCSRVFNRYRSMTRLFYDVRAVPTPFLRWYKDGIPLEGTAKQLMCYDEVELHTKRVVKVYDKQCVCYFVPNNKCFVKSSFHLNVDKKVITHMPRPELKPLCLLLSTTEKYYAVWEVKMSLRKLLIHVLDEDFPRSLLMIGEKMDSVKSTATVVPMKIAPFSC